LRCFVNLRVVQCDGFCSGRLLQAVIACVQVEMESLWWTTAFSQSFSNGSRSIRHRV